MSDISDNNNYIKKIPPMPDLTAKVFDFMRNNRNPIEDLTQELANHKEIEENILKLANSSYFSFGQEIKSVQKAIMFLGMMRTKNIIVALSVADMYCRNNYKKLYEHSLMCGIASKILAERCKTINPDDALAIGFLHDIGKTILYDNMEEDIDKYKNSLDSDVIEIENNQFQTNHCTVGSMLLKKWRMPNIVIDCIKYHHTPTLSALPGICGLFYIADAITSEGNFEDKLGNMPARLGLSPFDPKSINLMAKTKADSLMEIVGLK